MQNKSIIKNVCFIALIFLSASCNEMWGEYSLGNHLSLWGNDKKEDRIIVYCEQDCHGGIYVVPTYARHYDSTGQQYAEYVETATSNKDWVIVKTFQIKDKKENYYIVSKDFNIENLDCAKSNCDSILQSHVAGPLDFTEFKNKTKDLKVTLDFK
jgi:hypothetical protein